MKLNKWLFGAAAALMLGACSDNFADGPDGPNKPEEGGEGYVGINIQLPTVSGTRADDDEIKGGNDQFEDGVLSEYRVEEAVLLLFQGKTEAAATCTGAFNLKEAEPRDEDDPQLTRSSIRVANVKGLSTDSDMKLYALVITNGRNKGLYSQAVPYASWMQGKTIKEFQETQLSQPLVTQTTAGSGNASGIVMMNSPLSPIAGGVNTVGTISDALPVLVELNKTTYSDEKTAIANPAGTIHVERAVAKVTCSKFPTTTGLKVKIDDIEYELVVTGVKWDIAQDMKKTYAVRNTNRTPVAEAVTAGVTGNLWSWSHNTQYTSLSDVISSQGAYRMLGATQIKVTVNNVDQAYYRPYFCQVPGYGIAKDEIVSGPNNSTTTVKSNTFENKEFNQKSMDRDHAVPWTDLTKGPGAFYPRENTFPVEFMKYANTTRIGFWVTYGFKKAGETQITDLSSKNFYIKGADKSVLYLDDEYGFDPLAHEALTQLSAKKDDGNWVYPQIWDAVQAALDRTGDGSIDNVALGDLVEFTFEEREDALIVVTGVKFKDKSEFPAEIRDYFSSTPIFNFSTIFAGIKDNLEKNHDEYYKYSDRQAFYEVRVKHFGDDLTPWHLGTEANKDIAATTIDESYGTEAVQRRDDYLGRYGIVRNNWYDLSVNKILKLGDPEDPAKWSDSWNDTPDDSRYQYIAVELRVLSWARRNQNVDF